MSKTSRFPVLNGLLQSDLDGGKFNIFNLNGGGNQGRTAIVDAGAKDDNGIVGQGVPFLTIGAAVAAINADRRLNPDDHSGYLLLIRPGTYAYEGSIELHTPNLTILAYGALIQGSANEQTKLLVTSSNITIAGLSLDGAYDSGSAPAGFDTTDAQAGAITLNLCQSATLRDVTITNFLTAAVFCQAGWDGLDISHCVFTANQVGVLGAAVTRDTTGGNITDCLISGSRRGGIKFLGDGNTGTRNSPFGLLFEGNFLNSNDQANQSTAAIEISGFSKDCRILDNLTIGSANGVRLGQALRGRVADNIIRGATGTGILVVGHQQLDLTSNLIDGKNISGSLITVNGIDINGSYVSGNDSGPALVSNNKISDLSTTSGIGLQILNASGVVVTGNRSTALFNLPIGNNDIQIIANEFFTPVAFPAIFISTGGTAAAGFLIAANHFTVGGGSPTTLIQTDDGTSAGLGDVQIVGNTSTYGKHFSTKIYAHSGFPISGVSIAANLPISTVRASGTYDARAGWVNDDMVRMESDQFNVNPDSAFGYMFNGQNVVKARRTGWTAWTGSGSRATKLVSSATTADCAAAIKALLDDLIAHGLIGT